MLQSPNDTKVIQETIKQYSHHNTKLTNNSFQKTKKFSIFHISDKYFWQQWVVLRQSSHQGEVDRIDYKLSER